jgi:hypothetical protein
MINGQAAATIVPGHTFKNFIGPLPPGTTIASITCQNEQGWREHAAGCSYGQMTSVPPKRQ